MSKLNDPTIELLAMSSQVKAASTAALKAVLGELPDAEQPHTVAAALVIAAKRVFAAYTEEEAKSFVKDLAEKVGTVTRADGSALYLGN